MQREDHKMECDHIWAEDPTMNSRFYCTKCDSVKNIPRDEEW
jgi:hypothetical protein